MQDIDNYHDEENEPELDELAELAVGEDELERQEARDDLVTLDESVGLGGFWGDLFDSILLDAFTSRKGE